MRFVNRSLLFFSSRCDVYSFARVRFVLAGGDVGHSVVVVVVAVVEASSSLSIFCLAHPLYIYIYIHTHAHTKENVKTDSRTPLLHHARVSKALFLLLQCDFLINYNVICDYK